MARMFLVPSEVCNLLGCDVNAIGELVRRGNLRQFRDAGMLNYKTDEVEKIASSGYSGPPIKGFFGPVTDAVVMQCLNIAQRAHNGQKRRNGDDYVTHPMRMVEAATNNADKAVAALHDVVEDSLDNPHGETFTLQKLRDEGIPEHIVEAVDSVTVREGEDYGD